MSILHTAYLLHKDGATADELDKILDLAKNLEQARGRKKDKIENPTTGVFVSGEKRSERLDFTHEKLVKVKKFLSDIPDKPDVVAEFETLILLLIAVGPEPDETLTF